MEVGSPVKDNLFRHSLPRGTEGPFRKGVMSDRPSKATSLLSFHCPSQNDIVSFQSPTRDHLGGSWQNLGPPPNHHLKYQLSSSWDQLNTYESYAGHQQPFYQECSCCCSTASQCAQVEGQPQFFPQSPTGIIQGGDQSYVFQLPSQPIPIEDPYYCLVSPQPNNNESFFSPNSPTEPVPDLFSTSTQGVHPPESLIVHTLRKPRGDKGVRSEEVHSHSQQRDSIIGTKGLLNGPGQNNCFLNSAVQVSHV